MIKKKRAAEAEASISNMTSPENKCPLENHSIKATNGQDFIFGCFPCLDNPTRRGHKSFEGEMISAISVV